MTRIYSKWDFKCYTMMKQILLDLELTDKNYWWLISDIEAYPRKKEYEDLLENDYLLLSTSQLVKILEDDDFQWIWAVFSAIPEKYEKEDIMKFELPCVRDVVEDGFNPHNATPQLQHPYAEFELYAVDSSYMFLIADNEDVICRFKKSYPLYIEE